MIKRLLMLSNLWVMCVSVAIAAGSGVKLDKVHIDRYDKASLQRGMHTFMNYCSGCHSLKYLRFNQVAKDIGITDKNGEVDSDILVPSFVWGGDKATIYDQLKVAMRPQMAKVMFGKAPPDLSLEVRAQGIDWIYSFLHGFYQDESKLWGVNNSVFPDTAMPNVLLNLQGIQQPIFQTKHIKVAGGDIEEKVLTGLKLVEPGIMSTAQFDATVRDLVNFLAYAAEPHRLEQRRLGFWVLAFLIVFTMLAYLLKKEYWKSIK